MAFKRKSPIQKLCIVCGEVFSDTTPGYKKKTCGQACKRKHDQLSHREKDERRRAAAMLRPNENRSW